MVSLHEGLRRVGLMHMVLGPHFEPQWRMCVFSAMSRLGGPLGVERPSLQESRAFRTLPLFSAVATLICIEF